MRDANTRNGYRLDEVASAFQKSVRRGLLDDALYWGVELYLSGRTEFAWRRIMIIASEDVGLGDSHLPATLQALLQAALREQDRKNGREDAMRLFFVHAVVLVATASKSRLCDHAKIYHFAIHDKEHRTIPDYALDKHTKRGRELGRGTEHFFADGSQLAHLADVEDPYRDLAEKVLLENGPETVARAGPMLAGESALDSRPGQLR